MSAGDFQTDSAVIWLVVRRSTLDEKGVIKIMKIVALFATVALSVPLVVGSALADEKDKKGKGESMEKLCQGIPCGHLPPPGECRIWLPGKPAGQQSPPGKCDEIEAKAPQGAWIIYGKRK